MTTQTFRPISDNRTIGTIVRSTGATNFTLVDDAPTDDATYVTSAQSGASIWLGMAGITLAATERIKQCKVRVRGFHNSVDVGHTDSVDVRLRDPVTGKTTPAANLPTSSNTAVALETQFYQISPNGTSWQEVQFDRVLVDVSWQCRDTGLTQFRLTEVFLDADVHTQLSVTSVTVTGATSTTRPAFTFVVAADPDGDPQIRWQAKAFTSTQYGAAGFDPSTSTAAWASPVYTGSGTAGTVGADLLSGLTYKVYVRAAKNWPVSGTVWWSDWTASSAFSINLVPPAQPTIGVTTETTLPGYRTRVLVTLSGLNILDADTAGADATIGNWVAGANTNTPTLSATNPKSGTNDVLLTATGAGTIEALSGTFATSRRVDPGSVVSVTASLRALVTTVNWQVGIRFYDVAGATISTTMGSAVSVTSGGYTTPVLLNQTAPANAWSMNVRVLSASGAGAAQYRLDEAGIIVGATAPWSPGGAAQTGTVLVERSLRISSTIGRGPARNWLHPQLYSGGALTTSTDGFYPRQANDSVYQWPLDRAAPESPLNTTAGMIEWAIRVGSFSYVDIGAPDAVATDGMHPYLFPAVPGLSFTGSVWLWGSAAITVRLGLTFVDAFNTIVGSTTLTSNTALTTTAQKVTVTATAPAGTVYARMVVEDTLAATGVSVFMTQPKFRLTTDPDEAWPGQCFAFTWETVRFSGRAIPTTGETFMGFYDHEAPPGRPVMYRATINATDSTGNAISSTPSVPVMVYMPTPARTLIKDPFQPENAAVASVAYSAGDSTSQVTDTTEHHPMGRDRDPVFVRSWAGRDRQFQLVALTDLEQYRLDQVLPSSRSLLLQYPEGGQQYVLVRSLEENKWQRGRFRYTLGAAETARPS